MTRLSLRTRLVAVVVAVSVFALSAGGFATWWAFRGYLYGQLSDQLHGVADGRQQLWNRVLHEGPSSSGPVGGPPGVRAGLLDMREAILDPDGTQVNVRLVNIDPSTGVTIAQNTALKLTSDDAETLAAHPRRPIRVTTTDGKGMLAESRTLDNGQLVAAAVPTSFVQDNLARLVALQLAVGAAAILAAIALGTYGVRVGLEPLTTVSHTAREIARNLHTRGSGLERRVQPGNPRTEVGQLTDAVNTMLSAAQAAYAQRVENEDRMRRFLADASHELRTPLTSLRGYAELERLRAATVGAEDPEATKDALRRIETEGDRMARLVDDLLLLARTDQGSSSPELRPVAVDELLEEAADRAGAAHPGRPFVIDTPDTGLALVGDREVLLQVLGNLLRNSAIHTPGPRPIRLGARPDGASVLLLIADEGPGMPPDQAAHAFERFWRADSGRTRATGGSGLGLPIVHALVTAQHGLVTLTSDVATGTTARVRMPGVVDELGRLIRHPSHSSQV